MSERILGVGSRVKHPQMGKGVIVQVRSDAYEIGFVDFGVKQIKKISLSVKEGKNRFVVLSA